jgi:hypothetical protein
MDFKSKEGEPAENGQWRVRVSIKEKTYLASEESMMLVHQKKEMRC